VSEMKVNVVGSKMKVKVTFGKLQKLVSDMRERVMVTHRQSRSRRVKNEAQGRHPNGRPSK
jgi:hypothetical protein